MRGQLLKFKCHGCTFPFSAGQIANCSNYQIPNTKCRVQYNSRRRTRKPYVAPSAFTLTKRTYVFIALLSQEYVIQRVHAHRRRRKGLCRQRKSATDTFLCNLCVLCGKPSFRLSHHRITRSPDFLRVSLPPWSVLRFLIRVHARSAVSFSGSYDAPSPARKKPRKPGTDGT